MAQFSSRWLFLFLASFTTAFLTVWVLWGQVTSGRSLVKRTVFGLEFRDVLHRTMVLINLILEESIEPLLIQVLHLVGVRSLHAFRVVPIESTESCRWACHRLHVRDSTVVRKVVVL